MSCSYFNQSKDDIWNGIYCNKIGGRPGNSYWKYYCDSNCSDCPYLGGRDPYELHSDTKERNRVIDAIRSLPRVIQVSDYDEIKSARWAYDRLNYSQKQFVDNYSTLCAAESAYERAVEEEENRRRAAYEAERVQHKNEQEARIRKEREREDAHREQIRSQQTNHESRDYYSDPGPSVGGVSLSLTDRFLLWLENLTDPHMRSTHWSIRAYRVVLAVLMWIYVLAFKPGKPPVEVLIFLAFATLQLISFALAFAWPDGMKLRLALWLAELALLIVWGIMFRNAAALQYYHEVLQVALIYPAIVLIVAVVRWGWERFL